MTFYELRVCLYVTKLLKTKKPPWSFMLDVIERGRVLVALSTFKFVFVLWWFKKINKNLYYTHKNRTIKNNYNNNNSEQ